ncbi:HNH endonuclease [Sorangium sp. So ce1389]|uniref:HNH endonuclease n=1 Tax=Sorangium sp. So ce1389 TaxID=3133336 RepID=UPI003F6316F3
MRRCIYCSKHKDETEFNREHVIPQAFGMFEHNLVLECVCASCNQKFGDTVDRYLARDSIEGYARISEGLKRPAEFKSLGRRSNVEMIFDGGPLHGAYAAPSEAADDGSTGVKPAPQVGFAQNQEGPYKWYLLHELPTQEDFLRQGHSREDLRYIQFWGMTPKAARELWEHNGYRCGLDNVELSAPTGPQPVKTTATYSDVHIRAVFKIAINYLAATQGAKVAEHAAFESAIKYVAEGGLPPWRHVLLGENHWEFANSDNKSVSGNYVALLNAKNYVVVYLSIFMRQLWCARIAQQKDFLVLPAWDVAHVFDIGARQAVRVPVPAELKALPEE